MKHGKEHCHWVAMNAGVGVVYAGGGQLAIIEPHDLANPLSAAKVLRGLHLKSDIRSVFRW